MRKKHQPGCPCCCPDCDALGPWDNFTDDPAPTLSVEAMEVSSGNLWVSVEVSDFPAVDTVYDNIDGTDILIKSTTAEFAFQGVLLSTDTESTTEEIAELLIDRTHSAYHVTEIEDAATGCLSSGTYGASLPYRNLVDCSVETGLNCHDDYVSIRGGEFRVGITCGYGDQHVIVVASRLRYVLSNGCVAYGAYDYAILRRTPCGDPETTTDYKYAWAPSSTASTCPSYYYSTGATAPAGAPDDIATQLSDLLVNGTATVNATFTAGGLFSGSGTYSLVLSYDAGDSRYEYDTEEGAGPPYTAEGELYTAPPVYFSSGTFWGESHYGLAANARVTVAAVDYVTLTEFRYKKLRISMTFEGSVFFDNAFDYATPCAGSPSFTFSGYSGTTRYSGPEGSLAATDYECESIPVAFTGTVDTPTGTYSGVTATVTPNCPFNSGTTTNDGTLTLTALSGTFSW